MLDRHHLAGAGLFLGVALFFGPPALAQPALPEAAGRWLPPVAAATTVDALTRAGDTVIALASPMPFAAVGEWYRDFSPVDDDEVIAALRAADAEQRHVEEHSIFSGHTALPASLGVPAAAIGAVVFVQGTGSDRHSARNRWVASRLEEAGYATLRFDLTPVDDPHGPTTDRTALVARVLSAVALAGDPAAEVVFREQVSVAGRVGLSGRRPGVEVRQLDPQDRRLDRVEPAVDADQLVVVPRLHAVDAEQLERFGDVVAGRRQEAAVADPAEVLGGIEAEATQVAETSRGPPLVGSADGLGGILNHNEPARACHRHNRLHVGHLEIGRAHV